MPSIKQKLIAVYRPRTLPISVSPVLVGSALAFKAHATLDFLVLFLCIVCALCIQLAANAFNDVEDHKKNVDGSQRLGPKRAASEGWLQPKTIYALAWLMVLLAVLAGVYLVVIGGVVILVLGVFSLFFGWAYSAGPKPISATYWSELLCLLFFGLGGVLGSYYLQVFDWSIDAVLAGLGVGWLTAAVLLVNNYRDQHTDAQANRHTLVMVLGNTYTKLAYAGCFVLAYVAVLQIGMNYAILSLIGWGFSLMYRFAKSQPQKEHAPRLNGLLAETAVFTFLFSLLGSFEWVVRGVYG